MKHFFEHLFFEILKEISMWFGFDVQKWIILPFGVTIIAIYLYFILYFVYMSVRNLFRKDSNKGENADATKKELHEKQYEENDNNSNGGVCNMSLDDAMKIFENTFGSPK